MDRQRDPPSALENSTLQRIGTPHVSPRLREIVGRKEIAIRRIQRRAKGGRRSISSTWVTLSLGENRTVDADRRSEAPHSGEEAKDAFSSILSIFPVVLYKGQLSATDILALLRTHYDDFTERLARIDVAAVRKRIQHVGFLNEHECAEVLHCYRRSELQKAVEGIVNDGVLFSVGIGLYTRKWMEHVKQAFLTWMRVTRSVALVDALQEVRRYEKVLQTCEDETLEAMLSMWSEVQIHRTSIFDAQAELVEEQPQDVEAPTQTVLLTPTEKPVKLREKHTPIRKQPKSTSTTQGDLWA